MLGLEHSLDLCLGIGLGFSLGLVLRLKLGSTEAWLRLHIGFAQGLP